MRSVPLALALAVSLYGATVSGAEAPGVAVGANAPALAGKWLTDSGQPPALVGKAYLVMFWFGG